MKGLAPLFLNPLTLVDPPVGGRSVIAIAEGRLPLAVMGRESSFGVLFPCPAALLASGHSDLPWELLLFVICCPEGSPLVGQRAVFIFKTGIEGDGYQCWHLFQHYFRRWGFSLAVMQMLQG